MREDEVVLSRPTDGGGKLNRTEQDCSGATCNMHVHWLWCGRSAFARGSRRTMMQITADHEHDTASE